MPHRSSRPGADATSAWQPVPVVVARDTTSSPLPYAPPAVSLLGTLADLTLGGIDGGADDGFGGAGASGSI